MTLEEMKMSRMRFEEKLGNGYFSKEHSKDTEVDYFTEKQERDTIAIENFVRTDLFQELIQYQI